MAQYRKRKGNDTWHWQPDCSNYPVLSFDSAQSKPTSGELCNECKAKSKVEPKAKAAPKAKPSAKRTRKA